jgi:mannose-P-dolichol utilization defect protein 1
VYAYRRQFPFSTYGENLFLSVQNILITLLIISYSRPRLASGKESRIPQLLASSAIGITAIYSLLIAPSTVLQGLQMMTVPLSILSKLPQISQNYKAQSTGQLSAVAVISQVAGCVARLFTTATEVQDPIVLAGFAVALVLNLVLGIQMWLYWDQRDDDPRLTMEMDSPSMLTHQSSSSSSFPSVPPRYQSPTPGRRWARKVD